MSAVLLLCRANVCRSVMAQGLLSARLAERGIAVSVVSAGLLADGLGPPPEVISMLAARGIDVAGHRSRIVTAADLAAADLILGMAREQVRHAAVLLPAAWPRAFTISELVRRGRQAGARRPAEPLGGWLSRAGAGRGRLDLLGDGSADDVADPVGGPPGGYRAAADRLDRLTRDLVDLGWPSLGAVPESPGTVRDKGF